MKKDEIRIDVGRGGIGDCWLSFMAHPLTRVRFKSPEGVSKIVMVFDSDLRMRDVGFKRLTMIAEVLLAKKNIKGKEIVFMDPATKKLLCKLQVR